MKTILFLFMLLLASPAKAADVQIRELDKTLIINVIFETKSSQEDVWNILTDYNRISTFVNQIGVSKELHREWNDVVIEQVIVSNLWGLKTKNYVLFKVHEIPQTKITFVGYNRKGVQTCSGFWSLTNHSHIVHIVYNLTIEPKAVRFRLVSKSIILKTTKEIVEAMENEIQKRAEN